MKKYKLTLKACYLGFITQAIAGNFAPLLFLRFHRQYSIGLAKVALISSVFFFTQLLIDLFCAGFADRIGYRKCIVTAHICSASGLVMLAFLPDILPDPFIGIMASVVVYAVGSGLIEVLCSPIVEACPFDRKEAVMSTLHSFFCWGSVGVIVISTAFFSIFGIEHWKWLACVWALVPLYNAFNFSVCPIEHPTGEQKGLCIAELLRVPFFRAAIVLMVCAGASELSMSQWASAFAESALGLSKSAGDLAGPCLFAVAMGIWRAFYGKNGDRLDLMKFMLMSGGLCLASYLIASLTGAPAAGLAGCILCGFSVGIMWPGTISLCSAGMPEGGTAMFALLAMAGDLGGALGPAVVGAVTQAADDNIKKGLLTGAVFPAVLIISLILMKKMRKRKV